MTLYAVVEDFYNPDAECGRDWYENQLLGIYENRSTAFLHLRDGVDKRFDDSVYRNTFGKYDEIEFRTRDENSVVYGCHLTRRICPIEVNMGYKKLSGKFILSYSEESNLDYLN